MNRPPLLDVQNLNVRLTPRGGTAFNAVRDVSFTLNHGETFCIVGESGCGKSMTALAVLRLLPDIGRIESGRVLFNGNNLVSVSESQLTDIRGRHIGMVFQEPMTSLNPVLRVGDQTAEVLIRHRAMSRRDALLHTVELFRSVGIPEPQTRIRDYPHQLSGGLRQRVMIAMAMACNPSLILADEPTTALDVTVQRQILNLLRDQSTQRGMGMLMITHDLGAAAEIATGIGVMYAGIMVEQAPVDDFFRTPLHPYTQGLIASVPALTAVRSKRLHAIPGQVPQPWELPSGCFFRPRCPHAFEKCFREPPLRVYDTHAIRCWLHA